jgi:signal transduction histidine kinase
VLSVTDVDASSRRGLPPFADAPRFGQPERRRSAYDIDVPVRTAKTAPEPPSTRTVAADAPSRRAPRRRSSANLQQVSVPTEVPETVESVRAELARERAASAALRDVAVALGQPGLHPDALLNLILAKCTEVVDAERATLFLREEATGDLVASVEQNGAELDIRLRAGEGIAGHAATSGTAVVVNDAYRDPRFSPATDTSSGFRTRSILAVPMCDHRGNVMGVIQALNKRVGQFTPADASMLSALASQAAVSIENVNLYRSVLSTKEQLEHRVRDLKLLFDLESAMGRVDSLDALLLNVISEAQRVCEAKVGAVALADPETGLVILHVFDVAAAKIVRFPMRLGEGLIGACMQSSEIVMVANAKGDPRQSRELDERVGFKTTAALAVPLEGEDGVPIGAFALYNKDGGFTDEDCSLVLLVAANAATAIRLQQSRDAREREERLTTIGRLLSGVIHDLKTPLAVISGYVQLMQVADDRKVRDQHAQLVLTQFGRIMAMQRDVLEFARGEKSVLLRKVYLAQFFEGAQRELTPVLAKNHVDFVLELGDRGTARFDEGKIHRVVQNLARNAAEAMAPRGGGTFTIKVSRDREGALVLVFVDTGPGIPREIEHRLFRSFVTSGKKGGTGLGLAIVKRITEEHGGRITVRSSKDGATFRIVLPQPDVA